MFSTGVENLTQTLYIGHVKKLAATFSMLNISDEAKKNAVTAGLRIYAPGIKAIAVGVTGGRVDYVSAVHPQLGFVEISVND